MTSKQPTKGDREANMHTSAQPGEPVTVSVRELSYSCKC